ncbi:three-Cys-motif partner protein TcmP [Planctomycetales bacterium ZRK34]|nr:three-Cys-motif partner protein TcmP [Planctomycetales bacterium ZRK34]
MVRQHYGRELWDRMCDFVQEPDGLLEYDFGAWTVRKLFFLAHYLGITTHAMSGHSKFSSLNYIDLFCGSGVFKVVSEGSRVRRYPGSALLAAGTQKTFDKIYLVDQDFEALEAVTNRISRLGCTAELHTWCGDSNLLIDDVVAKIPDRALNIAFIDPYSLKVHFNTISTLAKSRAMDLIILFADRMDIERNVEEYYYPRKSDNLDLFLGEDSDWRAEWEQLENRDGGKIRQFFADCYLRQLKAIGYYYSRTKVIESDRGPLYRLIYASKNEHGLKFWDIAESEDVDRQRGLFGY